MKIIKIFIQENFHRVWADFMLEVAHVSYNTGTRLTLGHFA